MMHISNNKKAVTNGDYILSLNIILKRDLHRLYFATIYAIYANDPDTEVEFEEYETDAEAEAAWARYLEAIKNGHKVMQW